MFLAREAWWWQTIQNWGRLREGCKHIILGTVPKEWKSLLQIIVRCRQWFCTYEIWVTSRHKQITKEQAQLETRMCVTMAAGFQQHLTEQALRTSPGGSWHCSDTVHGSVIQGKNAVLPHDEHQGEYMQITFSNLVINKNEFGETSLKNI